MSRPATADRPSSRVRPSCLILLLAALACSACFEQPIDEQLTLAFLEDGSVEIEVTVEFTDTSNERQKEALQERVAERRQALLEGLDDWTARFRPMDPASERAGWEKESGELKRFVHSAVADDPQRDLRRFFADTDVTVFYERDGDEMELILAPGSSTRADRRQRERVRRTIDGYAESIADYLDAATRLWDYLDENRERTRDCLGDLFRDALADEIRETLEDTDEEEDRLIEALSDAMTPVVGILEVDADDAYSLDELSSLVYDPFPAETFVRVPGAIELIEGFQQLGDGRLRIRPSGFWEAFVAMEGRWIAPDPLVAYARATLDEKPLDLDGFIARERWLDDPPNASGVEEALVEALHPAASYRVIWRAPEEEAGR